MISVFEGHANPNTYERYACKFATHNNKPQQIHIFTYLCDKGLHVWIDSELDEELEIGLFDLWIFVSPFLDFRHMQTSNKVKNFYLSN
jgi:hypothetical protein